MKNPLQLVKKYFLEAHYDRRRLVRAADRQTQLQIQEYLRHSLYNAERYSDPLKLNRYEFQVFSQNGEDGIIQEIFNRIGTSNRYFVEFGCGPGVENNTAYLLIKGWRGFWMDGDENNIRNIQTKFQSQLDNRDLQARRKFITAENIEELFREADVPREFDLLSIDIDLNDYWVWNAIKSYRPRVVVIEYNCHIRPDVKYIVRYNPKAMWDGSSYYNSSLLSLELLGREKGYSLVGCNFTGANAFFVRQDLAQGKFSEPFSAENHYEPPRFYLTHRNGHPSGFGPFDS